MPDTPREKRFPSIMISLHYFVIPSSTEFPALTNRYTNVPVLIHTCLPAQYCRELRGGKTKFRRDVLLARHYGKFSRFQIIATVAKKISPQKLLASRTHLGVFISKATHQLDLLYLTLYFNLITFKLFPHLNLREYFYNLHEQSFHFFIYYYENNIN